jgi:hypothetical protein
VGQLAAGAVASVSDAGDHFGDLRHLATKALVDDPFGFRSNFLCSTLLQIGGEDARAADLLQEYEAKIAALERRRSI